MDQKISSIKKLLFAVSFVVIPLQILEAEEPTDSHQCLIWQAQASIYKAKHLECLLDLRDVKAYLIEANSFIEQLQDEKTTLRKKNARLKRKLKRCMLS